MKTHLLLGLLFALVTVTNPAHAGKKELGGKEYKYTIHTNAVFSLFIPDNVKVIRGVVGASSYFGGAGMYGTYRPVAKELEFAVILYYLGNPTEMRERARYDDLIAALNHFAKETGHPELSYAKLVPTGLSLGGRQATQFAGYDPKRCLAFFSFHGAYSDRYGDLLDATGIKGVPATFTFAETDDKVGRSPAQQAAAGRQLDAPWALDWDAKMIHPQVGKQDLNFAFLKAVAALRLPREIPVDKDFTMADINVEDGWLGLLETKGGPGKCVAAKAEIYPYANYPGDKTKAQWLPDEATAKLWLERNTPPAATP